MKTSRSEEHPWQKSTTAAHLAVRDHVIRIAVRCWSWPPPSGSPPWLLPDVTVDGGFFTYLWIALLFAVVNAILGPILHLLALPITAITLGLFALVVNAALVGITAALT